MTDEDKSLFVHLTQFASIVQSAADQYKPNLVARFALELCHHSNRYYQKNYILDETNPILSHARIALITIVVRVL